MGTHALEKPHDLGSANNPNRASLDDEFLNTEAASIYLRERWKIDLSASSLTQRRTFGKAPTFLKISQAVRYRKLDLDEFARTKGLGGLPELQPVRAERKAKSK